MPGRFIFDLFHEVKKNYKLDSYKLDNVSKLYLGDQKIDMPAKEMFRRYKEGDPKKLGEVAEYAVPQQPPPIMSSSATNQMRQIPEMLMCLPSLPASQVSCLFISLPVHNQPSCLSWETPQSDCGTVSSENKSVQYARKPVHEKRPDTAGTHV